MGIVSNGLRSDPTSAAPDTCPGCLLFCADMASIPCEHFYARSENFRARQCPRRREVALLGGEVAVLIAAVWRSSCG